MNEWIPVESGKFPKEREQVQVTYLGYNDGKPYCDMFASYHKGTWFWTYSEEEVLVKITAWRQNNDAYLDPDIKYFRVKAYNRHRKEDFCLCFAFKDMVKKEKVYKTLSSLYRQNAHEIFVVNKIEEISLKEAETFSRWYR